MLVSLLERWGLASDIFLTSSISGGSGREVIGTKIEQRHVTIIVSLVYFYLRGTSGISLTVKQLSKYNQNSNWQDNFMSLLGYEKEKFFDNRPHNSMHNLGNEVYGFAGPQSGISKEIKNLHLIPPPPGQRARRSTCTLPPYARQASRSDQIWGNEPAFRSA